MRQAIAFVVVVVILHAISSDLQAQALGQPDRGEPGDRMIQDCLERAALKIQNSFTADLAAADWQIHRPLYREGYF